MNSFTPSTDPDSKVVKWFHRANTVLKYNQVDVITPLVTDELSATEYTPQFAVNSSTLDPRKKVYLMMRCLDILSTASGSETVDGQPSYDIMIRVKTSSLA